MKTNRKHYFRIVALFFTISILLLDGIHILLPEKTYSETENRNLEIRPQLTWLTAVSGRYESRYEAYIEDQFPFRTAWLRCKAATDRAMGKMESNGIFLAADGYLIQSFTQQELDKLDESFYAMRRFCKRHPELKQFALIAPTAVSVLGDKLPKYAPVGDEAAFLDRIKQECSAMGIEFVDVMPALNKAAQTEQVYYRTDHHWTTHGAYTAYLAFAQKADLSGVRAEYEKRLVSDSFSGTLAASSGFRMSETDEIYVYLPKNRNETYTVVYPEEKKTSASLYHTDNLQVRDQYTIFLNGNHPLVTIQTDVQNEKILLILKDSYANCFVPFLMGDYTKIILVDPRYYAGDLELLLESEQVTDVLYLYNANSFASDTSLKYVIGEEGAE